MSVRLLWTGTAEQTLEQIFDYLSSVAGEGVARAIEGEIFERVEDLIRFPRQGRVVPEIMRPNIREVFVRSFRIIYQVELEAEPRRIFILGVIHPSQLLRNTIIVDILK